MKKRAKNSKLTVGLIHFFPTLGDTKDNLERGLALIRSWKPGRRPAVLVFPELWTTGYLAERSYPRLAERIPGATSRALASAARKCRIYLMAGSIAERRNGRVYNTALLFGPDGRLLLRHAKVHLWDREVDHFHAGQSYRMVRTSAGNFAVMICYDGDFPEVPRLLTLRGAEVLFHPSAYPSPNDDEWRLIYPAAALQNNVFIVQVNRIGSEKGLSTGTPVHFFGGSAVHGPNGKTILQAPFYSPKTAPRERIYTCSIDLAHARKLRRRSYLIDRRPGTYRPVLSRPA
ncbi:MAG: carbon-nitrogen hydrolase family protein [Acidobacteriota bacterium]|nr:carbon-nitrogen hydrolase family protein [Acidobacteriota bacterium]